MKSKCFKVNKLIRDKLPSILESKGISVAIRNMDNCEFSEKLKDKLLEEAKEVLEAGTVDELCEELADVLEVVHALCLANGLTLAQIEQKRLEKLQIKGGFDNKIFNSSIQIEENNQIIHYYLNKPHQYPEIPANSHQSDCLFCQFASKKREVNFYAKFEHCYVIKDQFPVSEGHILIIPFTHTENWFTAKEEVQLDMIKALQIMKEQLDAELSPHGYNIGANCGETAGQTIMHLHLHLIPRYQGDMDNPRGGVRGVIPSKQKY